MSEMFTKCNGFIVSGDPLVYADSATMTGQGTVSEPFGVKNTDLFVQEPLYTGTSGSSAYIGWRPDETVLWSGNASKNDTMQLSEPFSGFHYLEIYGSIVQDNGTRNMLPACKVCVDDVVLPASFNIAGFSWWGNISNYKIGMNIGTYASSYSSIQHAGGVFQGYWDSNWQAAENNNLKINRIVGINRKA